MTPRTAKIVCSRAPRHIVYVPAIRFPRVGEMLHEPTRWRCSFCGARVKVVA